MKFSLDCLFRRPSTDFLSSSSRVIRSKFTCSPRGNKKTLFSSPWMMEPSLFLLLLLLLLHSGLLPLIILLMGGGG